MLQISQFLPLLTSVPHIPLFSPIIVPPLISPPPFLHPHLSTSPPPPLCSVLSSYFFPKSSFPSHWRMEERSEESLTFSVRVFTLQEEVRAEEEHMETHEEVKVEAAEGALLYNTIYYNTLFNCVVTLWDYELFGSVKLCSHWSNLCSSNLSTSEMNLLWFNTIWSGRCIKDHAEPKAVYVLYILYVYSMVWIFPAISWNIISEKCLQEIHFTVCD